MRQKGLLDSRREMPSEIVARRGARWLVAAVYLISAGAFVGDVFRADSLAYGILYAPLVATALFHKDRRGLWVLSVIACLLVVIGAFMPVFGTDLPDSIGNRILSVLAIIATAAFVHHARDTQERLAAESRRAEDAERIKTDVLTNLSEEIRTPLHSLLGVLSLPLASGTPDHQQALGRVRSDGRHLLETIDNLLDLSRLEDCDPRSEVIDMMTLARDAVERARDWASERQITIGPRAGGDVVHAIGDSWATRRILDNLLANALRGTPEGGFVSVSVDRIAGTVTVSVSDPGDGVPQADLDADALVGGECESGPIGLALSARLARAMNGRLTARNLTAAGATTVRLALPAA